MVDLYYTTEFIKKFVKDTGITTYRSYQKWCKDNSEEKLRCGIPSEPMCYGKSWSDLLPTKITIPRILFAEVIKNLQN